jgi:hypothetical protein
MAAGTDKDEELRGLTDEVSQLIGEVMKVFEDQKPDYHTTFLALTAMLLGHMMSRSDDEDTLVASVEFISEQMNNIMLTIIEKDGATLQ